jgi:RNA polymerase sigma-70 factor, ECF subfamily
MPAPRTARCRPDVLQDQLEACGRGDAEAFEDLYESVAPRIYGLVLRILKDPHQSEEVTQEIFLELWRTSPRFDPLRGSAHAWVMTMAHHRAVDRVRSVEAWRRLDAADAQSSRDIPFDVTAATALAFLDARTVRTALATLCPAKRRTIELAYLDGHTYSEVAELMQIPLGTAKSRIRDGLIRLRDELTAAATQPV